MKWREYKVRYRLSWAEQVRRGRARKKRVRWGVSVDSSGNSHVDVQEAPNSWLHDVLQDLTAEGAAASIQQKELAIGPFVFDKAAVEYGSIGQSLTLVLNGRIVLSANTTAEAERLLDEMLGAGRCGQFTVLSELETLASVNDRREEEG